MAKITILNKAFELDMFDADAVERVETALEKVAADNDKILKNDDKKLSVLLREQCQSIFACFNAIFGEGADKKIFGGKANLTECMEALFQLQNAVGDAQMKAFNKRFAKYLPNRSAAK